MANPSKLTIALALTLIPCAAFSQQQSKNQASAFVLQLSSSQSCPVSMQAKQRGGGSVVSTGRGDRGSEGNQPNRIAQHIRLVLADYPLNAKEAPSSVTEVRVTVFGTSGKWRVLTANTGSSQPDSPYIEKTLTLTLSQSLIQDGTPGETSSAYADFDLPGFTSVKSIRLDSATYADGNIWTPRPDAACRVYPDPLMLVSTR